jgi:hypothetical protein
MSEPMTIKHIDIDMDSEPTDIYVFKNDALLFTIAIRKNYLHFYARKQTYHVYGVSEVDKTD